MEAAELIKTILDLGLSGILLYFITVVWRDRKETISEKNDVIKDKDTRAKEMADNVLEVVKENTRTQQQLRSAIEDQKEVTKTLTKYVYDALKK